MGASPPAAPERHVDPRLPLPPAVRRAATTALAAALLAIGLLASPRPAAAAGPTVVDLGRAAPFAILAGAGVGAAKDPSHVTGEIGAYPLPAVSGRLDTGVDGVVHRGGAIAQLAQADLATAYAVAAAATPTGPGLGASVEGGAFVGGVYALAGDSISIRGHLVLDGEGDRDASWVFQVPSDLATSPDSTIELVNGAQACHVFWQVGGAATLGAGSTFAGTILATKAVNVGGGVTLDGRLFTTTGRVLLDGDAIRLPVCTSAAPAIDARAATVAGVTSTDGPPPSAAGVAAPAAGHQPSILPLVAIAALVLAAILGEPRRGRRPAAVGPW